MLTKLILKFRRLIPPLILPILKDEQQMCTATLNYTTQIDTKQVLATILYPNVELVMNSFSLPGFRSATNILAFLCV